MAVNRVDFGGNTLIDLTGDTLESAEQLLKGIIAHSKDGSKIVGALEAGGGGSFDLSNFLQNITDVISFSFTPISDGDKYKIIKPSENSIPRMGFVYADDISYDYNKSILCCWLYTAVDPYTDVSSGANLQAHIFTSSSSSTGTRIKTGFLLTSGNQYGCLSSSKGLNYITIKSQEVSNNKAILKAGIQYNGFVFFGD